MVALEVGLINVPFLAWCWFLNHVRASALSSFAQWLCCSPPRYARRPTGSRTLRSAACPKEYVETSQLAVDAEPQVKTGNGSHCANIDPNVCYLPPRLIASRNHML
jgi:hypothetical protein